MKTLLRTSMRVLVGLPLLVFAMGVSPAQDIAAYHFPFGPSIPEVSVKSYTAVADGKDAIVIVFRQSEYFCNTSDGTDNGPLPWTCDDGSISQIRSVGHQRFWVSATGEGNTFEKDTACAGATSLFCYADGDGYAEILWKSTVAETKSFYVTIVGPDTSYVRETQPIEVTFTPAPELPTPAAQPQNTNPNQPANVTPANEPTERPTTPTLDAVTRGGQKLQNNSGLVFMQGDSFTIGGQASPGSTVRLFIFSEPKQAEVVAGEDGRWTYDVSGLEPGSHHIEAETIDKSGLTSNRSTIMTFAVTSKKSEANISNNLAATPSDSSLVSAYVSTGAGMVVLALLLSYIFRKKLAVFVSRFNKRKKANSVKRIRKLK